MNKPVTSIDQVSSEDRLALAKVGLIALIDEATKFQEVRKNGELKEKMEGYMGKERKLRFAP